MTEKVFQQIKIKIKNGVTVRQVYINQEIAGYDFICNIFKTEIFGDNITFWYYRGKQILKISIPYKNIKDIQFD